MFDKMRVTLFHRCPQSQNFSIELLFAQKAVSGERFGLHKSIEYLKRRFLINLMRLAADLKKRTTHGMSQATLAKSGVGDLL